jgi:hypothetical protein
MVTPAGAISAIIGAGNSNITRKNENRYCPCLVKHREKSRIFHYPYLFLLFGHDIFLRSFF